jgi:hypothetical protein
MVNFMLVKANDDIKPFGGNREELFVCDEFIFEMVSAK